MQRNDLAPIEHNNQRILTTQQIAEFYGTEAQVITNNYNRNKERYAEGKHYYCLEGEELRAFRTTTQIDLSIKINKLYLWTERGALLHAKSLGTDKAWQVYEQLVETYFRARERKAEPIADAQPAASTLPDLKLLNTYMRLANNKNVPAGQKEILLDMMFRQITGQDAPKPIESALPTVYTGFGSGLNRFAWLIIDGMKYINTSYNRTGELTVARFTGRSVQYS